MKQPLFEYDDEADEITVDFGSGTRRVELYVNANKVASLRAEVEALKFIIRNIVKTQRAFGANEFADAIEQQVKAALRGEVE